MQINEAKFLVSNTDVEKCPAPALPEYAFIGRSNVGKSSLINMLTGNKNLAKTSGTPGKTQLINHFLVNNQWYMADLPGYGFAKVSKSQKKDFEMKRMNPGWDLLLGVDWDKELQAAATRSAEIVAAPPPAELPAPAPSSPETVKFTSSDSATSVAASVPTKRSYTLAFVGVGALVLVAGLLIWRGGHKNS